MKKYLYTLVIFILMGPSSLSAMESITTLNVSTAEMNQIPTILKENGIDLSRAIIFFDKDETLSYTVGICSGHEFKLLACPDRGRTYADVYRPVVEEYNGSTPEIGRFDLQYFDFEGLTDYQLIDLVSREIYKVLDPNAEGVIKLLKEQAFDVRVCSGLPWHKEREEFLRTLGLGERYLHDKRGKVYAICDYLRNILNKGYSVNITTLILIDNSEKHGITPFLQKLPELLENLGIRGLKLMGILYTRFGDMVTKEAIEEELNRLDHLRSA